VQQSSALAPAGGLLQLYGAEQSALTFVGAFMEKADPPEPIPDSILLAAARLQAALEKRSSTGSSGSEGRRSA